MIFAFLVVLALGVCAQAEGIRRSDLKAGVSQNSPGVELFLRIYEVFSHPRCSNCHPRDDRPRWGTTAIRLHAMNVQRGEEPPPPPKESGDQKQKGEGGYGRLGMTCATCHGRQNGPSAGSPPGAENWRLAPKRMGWAGLTAAELCQQLKDPARGENIEAVMDHIVRDPNKTPRDRVWKPDPLVEWAWDPGHGRERAPGEFEEFAEVLTWWMKSGARCPAR